MTALHVYCPGSSVRRQRMSIMFACLATWMCSLPLSAQILTKEDLQKETMAYEAASRNAQRSDMPAVQAGRIWSHLGTLYQDAGKYDQSQSAYEHAMRLLTIAPVSPGDLAVAIDNLGTLYVETGNAKEAERAELKALKIREEAGLKSELPKSWYHLASLYVRERRPAKSESFAKRAVDAFSREPNAAPEDKIGSLLVLASSACQSHRYSEAISEFQTALQLTMKTYGPEDYPTGLNMFLLGYAYWKNGDPVSARDLMERGYEIVGKEMGWHPAYLSFMTQYAHFLRDQHNPNEAHAIEEEIKQKRAQLNADPSYNSRLQTMDLAALF
jgi:tetratricopeptide (TPR) repeat protein